MHQPTNPDYNVSTVKCIGIECKDFLGGWELF